MQNWLDSNIISRLTISNRLLSNEMRVGFLCLIFLLHFFFCQDPERHWSTVQATNRWRYRTDYLAIHSSHTDWLEDCDKHPACFPSVAYASTDVCTCIKHDIIGGPERSSI